jgi:hypothetical protein
MRVFGLLVWRCAGLWALGPLRIRGLRSLCYLYLKLYPGSSFRRAVTVFDLAMLGLLLLSSYRICELVSTQKGRSLGLRIEG